MSADDIERLQVGLNSETKREVRVAAARRDMSMSELVGDVVEDWLDEHSDE